MDVNKLVEIILSFMRLTPHLAQRALEELCRICEPLTLVVYALGIWELP